MKRTLEPFWWALFGAGGVLSALCIPALLFLFGLAVPLGWVQTPSHEHVLTLAKSLLGRLSLFSVISLSLFHWAHRFRFTLYDGLQLKHLNELIAVLCYGTAIAVTIVAGKVLLNL
jgi:fumarate reductase subunit D